MTLNGDQNLIILEYLVAVAADISECGYIVPAPIRFESMDNFWANLNPKTTQKDVETSEIAFTTLTMLRMPRKPPADGDAWEYYYNFHVFRRYTLERADETETPDDFLKRTLKSYTLFLKAVLDLNAAFYQEQVIEGLGSEVVEVYAQLADANDFFEENEPGRYLETVNGFGADVPITVTVKFKDC
jgi:hypothetical protein